MKCSLVKSKNQFNLFKYLSSVWFGVGLRFSAAGQCIGTDRPVSALFFLLKEQLERPVVTKTSQGSARAAASRAAACSEPRGVWPSWNWTVSQGCLGCPTQPRPAGAGVHDLLGLTEGAGAAASAWLCRARPLGACGAEAAGPGRPAACVPTSLPGRSTAPGDSAWVSEPSRQPGQPPCACG